MTTIITKLESAAGENANLLATLTATDYAAPALTQQKAYIADLRAELQRTDKAIQALETTRLKELKDHEKYRDSVLKRFAYKVSRKEAAFAEKAAQEEREYFAALQAEHHARESRRSLAASLAEAEQAQPALEQTAGEHAAAQKALDALYASIFAGPTPAFPAEDEAEQAAQRAEQEYQGAGARRATLKQVLEVMVDAGARLQRALRSMESARDASRMDMFGGGMMADMMERSNLGDAETHMHAVHRLMAQAGRLAPEMVKPLPGVEIAQGSLMSDVFFDNIFTDMAFHDKIKQSQAGVQRAAKALDEQIHGARLALRDSENAETAVKEKLDAARKELQKRRQEAFESVKA